MVGEERSVSSPKGEDQIPPYIRMYHCFGGLRIEREYPEQKSRLHPPQKLKNKIDPVSIVGGLVGVDFFTFRDQVEGFEPPEWRLCKLKGNQTDWLLNELDTHLQLLRHSAQENNQEKFSETCWQIGFHLQVCDEHLRRISDAYHLKLRSLVRTHDTWDVGMWISTGYSIGLHTAIYSFLQECCVLRDCLARAVRSHKEDISSHECDSWRCLQTHWSPSSKVDKGLASIRSIHEQANKKWIRELGDYRNCYVHDIPLHRYISPTELCESQGLRFIEHYLPNEAREWRSDFARDQVPDEAPDQEGVVKEIQRYKEHFSLKRDALKYCHSTMLSFCELVWNYLDAIAPVKPASEIPVIEPLPGSIKWTPDRK